MLPARVQAARCRPLGTRFCVVVRAASIGAAGFATAALGSPCDPAMLQGGSIAVGPRSGWELLSRGFQDPAPSIGGPELAPRASCGF